MLKVLYDRDYRTGREKSAVWFVGNNMPVIAPHRIVELHADEEELEHIEEYIGTSPSKKRFRAYGDIARTVWLNLQPE